MVDTDGSTVPESVFVAGRKVQGTWTRPTIASVATLQADDGSVIELTPGTTWVHVTTEGAGMLSS